VVAPGAQRAGGQFGFEQTVNPRLTLAADWVTGRHANGYFTPGAIFKPHPRVTGYAGYSVGNGGASRGNHFFLLELGYNFNGGGKRRGRHRLHHRNDPVLPARAPLRARVREGVSGGQMSVESTVLLAVAALLLVYLAYALLRPEKF
jgi:K+-transporting ATPase KdpF subunit